MIKDFPMPVIREFLMVPAGNNLQKIFIYLAFFCCNYPTNWYIGKCKRLLDLYVGGVKVIIVR